MDAEHWLGPRVRLVAEIGACHQGSEELARRLVEQALRAGCGLAKGQVRTLEIHPEWRQRSYTGPHSFGRTYYEHRRSLELPLMVHLGLRDLARSRGGDYSVSVWDLPAAEAALEAGGWGWLKIPSAALTDIALHRRLAREEIVVVLSTGMSTRDEILRAVDCYPPDQIVVLVCTSAYPVENADIHLRRIHEYRSRICDRVGVSGHWRGVQVDAAAVALGYRLIERHITLDRTMRGTDHAAALGPRGTELWVRDVRAVEEALGEGRVGPLPCEAAAREKLRGS